MVYVLGITDMVLHAGAVAAGKIIIVIAVFPYGTGAYGQHIRNAVVGVRPDDRVLAGRDLVIKGPFVIIHKPAVLRIIKGKHTGELEHVVGGAGFTVSAALNVACQDIRLFEILPSAHAAGGIGIMGGHKLPEIPGGLVIMGFSGGDEFLQGADHLGDMLIGMQPGDGVKPPGKSVKDRGIVKHGRSLPEFCLPGYLVQAGQGFVHAAVFSGDIHTPHLIPLLRGGGRKPPVNPEADPFRTIQGGPAVQLQIAVQQTGQQLVQGIIGRPDSGIGGELLQQRKRIRGIGPQIAFAPFGRVTAPKGLGGVGRRAGGGKRRGIAGGQQLQPA